MGLLNWLIMEFVTGFILYIGGLPLLARQLPVKQRNRICDFYFGQAFFGWGRAVLARVQPGYTITGSTWDDEYACERPNVGSETHRFFDPYNSMTTAYNRPFGIVLPGERGNGLVTDARVALVGARNVEEVEEGRRTYTDEDGERHHKTWLAIDSVSRLVDVEYAKDLLNSVGSASSTRADTIEELVEKSQLGYKSRSPVEMMTIAIAFVGSHLVGWFTLTQLGGGGSIPVDAIPMMLGVIL